MRRIQTCLAQMSRIKGTILYVLLAFSTGLSAWEVASFAGERSGYAATYATGAAYFFGCTFALAGLVLIPWRKTRWFGLTSLASAVWLTGSYLGAVNILYRLDLVRWKGEHEVSLLPEPGTGYYVYFQQGTSDAQIENFSGRVLYEPPSIRGRDFKTGIHSYVRLTPVDGREVIAIELLYGLTLEQRRDLRFRIQSERIVAEISDSSLPGRKR